jgi:hypothetical protein
MTSFPSLRKNAGPSTGEGLTGPVGSVKGPPGEVKVVKRIHLWLVCRSLVPRSSLNAMMYRPLSECTVASITEKPGSKKISAGETVRKSVFLQCQMRWSWPVFCQSRGSPALVGSTTDDQIRW